MLVTNRRTRPAESLLVRAGMRTVALVAALGAVLSLHSPARSEIYFDHTVAESTGRLQGTCLADHGDAFTLVGWQDDQSRVFTRALVHGVWQPAVLHGTGGQPAVHLRGDTVWLAWASGIFLQVRPGDLAGAWGDVELLSGGTGYPVARPDFGSWPGGDLHLAWEEGSRILYARRDDIAWSTPEVVCIDGNTTFGSHAQVEPKLVAGIPRPRVYYLRCPYPGEHQLHYRQHDGSTWSAPIMVAGGAIAEEYRVARYPDGRHAALGIGLSGGCECNHLYYVEETESGWTYLQDLTIDFEELNKPCYCSLAADPAGAMHAFWQQEFRQAGGPPLYTMIFWKWRAGGTWNNAPTGFFGGRTGTWTRIASPLEADAAPSFTWIEGTAGGGSRIVMKRTLAPEAVPEPDGSTDPSSPGASDGDVRPALRAFPNPAAGPIAVRWNRDGGGEGTTMVIVDPQGRVVRRCLVEWSGGSVGETAACAHWDLRDSGGHPVPAGSYFAGMGAGSGEKRIRIVVIR